MPELSVSEVAVAGGTTEETVEELTRVGVISPQNGGGYRPSDVRRVRLTLALATSGVPFDAVADAILCPGNSRLAAVASSFSSGDA